MREQQFSLGQVIGVLLGYELSSEEEIFPLEPILTFMSGVPIRSVDAYLVADLCRNSLLCQFPRFGVWRFVCAVSNLSLRLAYASGVYDTKRILSQWLVSQRFEFGDSFSVRPVNGAIFLELTGDERDCVVLATCGQDPILN